MSNQFIVFGPPGCGKSTYITRQIRRAAEVHGADRVMATSFTKAAATELATKEVDGQKADIPKAMVGTLHSLCYRALDRPPLAETLTKEFNEQHPQYALTGIQKPDVDDLGALDGAGSDSNAADALFATYQLLRARGVHDSAWPMTIQGFAKVWEAWKDSIGAYDFNDLIEYGPMTPPGNPRVLFCDEAQDNNHLQTKLLSLWSQSVESLVYCADDDQCHPAGTMIETADGPTRIEDLQGGTGILAWSRNEGLIYGRRKRLPYSVGSRQYSGTMHRIAIGDLAVESTADHLFYARWAPEAREYNCVYLMRKGDLYRVGWCQLFRSDGNFHLGIRARLEEADAAWILRVCRDRAEASIWEKVYSTRYGIPQVTFRPVNGAQHFTADALRQIFDLCGPELVAARAEELLRESGLDPTRPLWNPKRAYDRRGGSTVMVAEACNLLPNLMLLPTQNTSSNVARCNWEHFTVYKTSVVDLPVYSIDVPNYKSYVANGIIVHNCIYSFSGADPSNLLDAEIPDANKRVLQQSHRIPRAVHAYSTAWIEKVSRREPKVYLPRDAQGEVRGSMASLRDIDPEIDRIRDLAGRGESVMILASCGYMLRGWIERLRDAGIAYHNPYRPSRGDWSPLKLGEGGAAARVSSFLAHDNNGRPGWTMWNLGQWLPLLKADGVLRRGAKAEIEREAEAHPGYRPTLEEVGHRWLLPEAHAVLCGQAWPSWPSPEALAWLTDHVLEPRRKTVGYAASIARQALLKGADPRKVLADGPAVIVGTSHSVKGGEARHVYVAPDLSPQAAEHWHRGAAGRDEVRRVFYVAFTRASETLTLLRPMGRLSVEF